MSDERRQGVLAEVRRRLEEVRRHRVAREEQQARLAEQLAQLKRETECDLAREDELERLLSTRGLSKTRAPSGKGNGASPRFMPRPDGRYRDLCGGILADVYPSGLPSSQIVGRLRLRGGSVHPKSVSSALSTLKSKGLARHAGKEYVLTEEGYATFATGPTSTA